MQPPRVFLAAATGWRRSGISVLAGAVIALGQAPFSQPIALFFAFPVLFWTMGGAANRSVAARIGWSAGLGYFAASLTWIVEPFLVDIETFGWMAPFALILMAGGLALFWAAGFALGWSKAQLPLARALRLAAGLCLAEYARSFVLTGFPWGLLAYSWSETPVFQGLALIGPHGLGLLTLLAVLFPATGDRRAVLVSLGLVALGWGYGTWALRQPETGRPLHVRIVQPNADQRLKWRPEYRETFEKRLLRQSLAEAQDPVDVIIWPETAVTRTLKEGANWPRDLMREVDVPLILGAQHYADQNWFNALALLQPDSSEPILYDKHHLVPFGEYIPFGRALARYNIPVPSSMTLIGFAAGPGPEVISAPGIPPFLPLICYEAIFPQGLWVSGSRPHWLVQITNDAWFGTFSGPYQHLVQARARTIEQRLPMARAANTGISAAIDTRGRLIEALGSDVEGHLDATLHLREGGSLYSRLRDFPTLFVILTIFLLTLPNVSCGYSRSYR